MTGRWILKSVLFSCLLGLVAMTVQVHAADHSVVPSGGGHVRSRTAHRLDVQGPYPLSWRAAKIRRADRCWRGCLAGAGREFQRCLRFEAATDCVPWNDANDRVCLRECRLSGGPLVGFSD
jgi:hypothetical protein